MSSRVACAGLGLLVVALLSLRAGEAWAGRPRIAVIGLKSVGPAAPDLRDKMDAAVAGGLAASGAEVVDSATTRASISARGIAGCETASCFATVGQASGATHVVRGSIEVEGRSYTVRLEMLDAATGAVLERREDRCEICTEAEGYETASVSASALKAQVFKRRPVAGPEGTDRSTSPPALVAASDPTTAGTAPAANGAAIMKAPGPRHPEPKKKAAQSRALGWVAVSAAVLALSAGITLMVIDGRGTCSPSNSMDLCRREYDTMAGGLLLTALGAATGTIGILSFSGQF